MKSPLYDKLNQQKRGISLIEAVIYTAIFVVVSLVVINMLLATVNAFNSARVSRTVNEQGTEAMERILREIKLATNISTTTSVFGTNPGILALNTFTDYTGSATTTRTFSVQNGILIMEDSLSPAVALTNGITVTNLVFRRGTPRTAYYVRKSGDDSNDCLTPATACLTIQEGHDKATADGSGSGDIIYVGSGTYNESILLGASGTAENSFYLFADTTGFYTGDAPGAVTINSSSHGIEFPSSDNQTGIDYVVIDGFTIVASNSGIRSAQGSDYNVIRRCTIDADDSGILLTSDWGNGSYAHSTGWLIEDNDIFGANHGIFFNSGEYTDALVQNNTIHDNSTGIRTTDGGNNSFEPGNNVTIRHNVIYNNSIDGIRGHKWFDGVFFNNLIYDNDGDGFEVPHRDNSSAEVMTIRNNTIHNNGGDGMIFGNSSNRGAMHTDTIIENNVVTNNADDGMDITLGEYCTIPRNNNVWGNINDNYEDCTDLTGSNGNISTDPLYTNGFYLSQIASGQGSNSPSVNTGNNSSETLQLNVVTTRTDLITDTGTADMGYHYPTGSASTTPAIPSVSQGQFVKIEMTLQGGAGRFQKSQTFYGTAVLRGSY